MSILYRNVRFVLLPEVGLFTARIRSMGKVMFSVYPPPGEDTSAPGSSQGLWYQVISGGYPNPRFFQRSLIRGPGGYPNQGGTPLLSWSGGYPTPVMVGGGYPVFLGYPLPQPGLGYLLDGGYPRKTGYPLSSRRYASSGLP